MFNKIYFSFVSLIASLIYKKRKLVLPNDFNKDEPSVFVANHSGIIGPVMCVKYFNLPKRIWLTSAMINKECGPNYFFHDMMLGRSSKNPKSTRRSAKMIFKLIYPLIYKNKRFIIVNKSNRGILNTFNESVEALKSMQNLIIFPESHERYGKYINKFHKGFTSMGKYYYKKTGKLLKFYPMYIPNGINTINVGKPIVYDPCNDPKLESEKICLYLQSQIEQIGSSLPKHEIIPYVSEDFYKFYGEYEFDEMAFYDFVLKPYSE